MNKYSKRGSSRGPRRNSYYSNSMDGGNYNERNKRIQPSNSEQKNNFSTGTIAVLAGVLILGVGIGLSLIHI